jgi:hypothetical protein
LSRAIWGDSSIIAMQFGEDKLKKPVFPVLCCRVSFLISKDLTYVYDPFASYRRYGNVDEVVNFVFAQLTADSRYT